MFKKVMLIVAFAGVSNIAQGINTGKVYTNMTKEIKKEATIAIGKQIFIARMFKVEPLLPMKDIKRDNTTRGLQAAVSYLAAKKIAHMLGYANDINRNDFGIIAISAALVSYYLNEYVYEDMEEEFYGSNLLKFLQRWETYKEFTPEDLHPLFDELAERLANEGEDAIRKLGLEVTKTMEDYINHTFEEHYFYLSQKKSSHSHSSTDLISRFVGAAKNVYGNFDF